MANNHCGLSFDLRFLAPRFWPSWGGLAFFFLLARLPAKGRHALGKLFGRLIFRFNRKRRQIVLTNLKLCFPELDDIQTEQLARQQLEWHGRALIDYSRFFFTSRSKLARQLSIEGKEHIEEAIAQNKNVIILLAHSVMLEFGPAALSQHYSCYGSYKPSRNPIYDWIIARSRCRYVDSVISRDEGMLKLVRSLRPGKLMIFLPDEDLGAAHSVFAPFFGVTKATLTTPARLARLAKAVCLPAFVHFDEENQRYQLTVGSALTIPRKKDANTIEKPVASTVKTDTPSREESSAALMNSALEGLIRQHPAQYMWTLKLFKTRPEGEKPHY